MHGNGIQLIVGLIVGLIFIGMLAIGDYRFKQYNKKRTGNCHICGIEVLSNYCGDKYVCPKCCKKCYEENKGVCCK